MKIYGLKVFYYSIFYDYNTKNILYENKLLKGVELYFFFDNTIVFI